MCNKALQQHAQHASVPWLLKCMINWRKHVCLLQPVKNATHVWLAASWPVISAKPGQQARRLLMLCDVRCFPYV
jgi:hypothetical protein